MFRSLVELKSMAGRQATAPNRQGGVAVSLTTSQRLEFRSDSHLQVTQTRKTFQTFANAAVVRRSVEKLVFLSTGNRLKRYGANVAPLSSQNQ